MKSRVRNGWRGKAVMRENRRQLILNTVPVVKIPSL